MDYRIDRPVEEDDWNILEVIPQKVTEAGGGGKSPPTQDPVFKEMGGLMGSGCLTIMSWTVYVIGAIMILALLFGSNK